MKLVKYFESKVFLFEFIDNLFYNDGKFYPINSIYFDNKYTKLINSGNGYKKISGTQTFVAPKQLDEAITIFYYSADISEPNEKITSVDVKNLYIEIGNKYFPIQGNSFFISKDEKKIDFSEDKKTITFDKKKYYITSKTITSAYVIDKKSSSSGSDNVMNQMVGAKSEPEAKPEAETK